MSKRKPLPYWANKIGLRIIIHAQEIKDLSEAIAENPSDRKRVMQMHAEAYVVEQLVDQLLAPEDEDEKPKKGNVGD